MQNAESIDGAGVAFKAAHFEAILADPTAADFVEVHAENYLGAGGLPHAQLTALREKLPLSVHGVGLSLGGTEPLDRSHLQRIRALCERYAPALVSEHLAWTSHEGVYQADLLPVSFDRQTLRRVVDRVDQLQNALQRQVLIENPALYLELAPPGDLMDEVDFLDELSQRSGCGLLLDIGNVLVSAHNCARDPVDYLVRFPIDRVGEIHLAGHSRQALDAQEWLLIDDHATPVAQTAWELLREVIARGGPRPVLIEWDRNLPAWQVLAAEVATARSIMDGTRPMRATASRPRVNNAIQCAFRLALDEPRAATPELLAMIRSNHQAARIGVYSNNARSALGSTLRAAFPAVERLLGEGYFGAVSAEFVRHHPPSSPVLHEYGGDFAGFIDDFSPLHGFPYLGDIARLEWARRTAFHAADAPLPVFDSGSGAALQSLVEQRLGWHPSLQMLHSAHPILRLWQSQVDNAPAPPADEWHPETLIVWRRGWHVEARPILTPEQELLKYFEHPRRICRG